MELKNEFTVAMPLERAWGLLTDIERIAPCMPGATLEGVEDGKYNGNVKVKVGPVTTQYKGTVSFLERDESAHRAVLRAEGREARGQGSANATITAALQASGDSTAVAVTTDLTITGRVAQFGRGVLEEVSSRLLGQFVDALEASLADEAATDAAGAASSDADSTAPASEGDQGDASGSAEARSHGAPHGERTSGAQPGAPVEPVDLLAVAGGSVAKRIAAGLGGLAVVVAIVALLRRVVSSTRATTK